jgi:hypothetical protein
MIFQRKSESFELPEADTCKTSRTPSLIKIELTRPQRKRILRWLLNLRDDVKKRKDAV